MGTIFLNTMFTAIYCETRDYVFNNSKCMDVDCHQGICYYTHNTIVGDIIKKLRFSRILYCAA